MGATLSVCHELHAIWISPEGVNMASSVSAPVNIQIGGNVENGNIVVGDNNFVVNTNHGTIVYPQAKPQVRLREFAPQAPRAPRGFINRTAELQKLEAWISS